MIEKKSVINLLEAYAVSIKHYLRGEDGIYYESATSISFLHNKFNQIYRDLYYLVKFLPGYAMPAGIPTMDNHPPEDTPSFDFKTSSPRATDPTSPGRSSLLYQRTYSSAPDILPIPATASSPRKATFFHPTQTRLAHAGTREKTVLQRADEGLLLPAHMPPKYHIFDLFPFSLLIRFLTKKGREIKGKKAARLRAKMRQSTVSHNLPLEISLYLVSFHSVSEKIIQLTFLPELLHRRIAESQTN